MRGNVGKCREMSGNVSGNNHCVNTQYVKSVVVEREMERERERA